MFGLKMLCLATHGLWFRVQSEEHNTLGDMHKSKFFYSFSYFVKPVYNVLHFDGYFEMIDVFQNWSNSYTLFSYVNE